MSENAHASSRRELLIDGRRVRVSDLLAAGLLRAGQELVFREHKARVTDRGRLRLDDGREFTTPSGAAAAAAETNGIPGWTAWKTTDGNGVMLHHLRQQLMEEVARELSSEDKVSGEFEVVRRIFETLNEARLAAESGAPRTMTVRELLRYWWADGHARSTNTQIAADLANHGLKTLPDFRAVHPNRSVELVLTDEPESDVASRLSARPSKDPSMVHADGDDEQDGPDGSDDDGDPEIGLTLGNLLPSPSKLGSVAPTATFEAAITAMQLNDFSQLAVLANGHLHGVISWKSIAEAKHRDPDARFSDAVDRSARVFDYNVRLLDVLDVLRQHGFIFVRDFDHTVNGIVTESDVVNRYDEVATPFVLIGEVDQELRQVIQSSVDEELAHKVCESAGKSFTTLDSMTMGHYQTVLTNKSCWNDLGWPLDRKVFGARLDEIRRLRNRIMHFNPETVSREDVQMIRNFLLTIRQYCR